MLTTSQPDDFLQRLGIIRRHLRGLELAIDALEREMLALHAPQSDGERAAATARQIVYRQGPSEVKLIHD